MGRASPCRWRSRFWLAAMDNVSRCSMYAPCDTIEYANIGFVHVPSVMHPQILLRSYVRVDRTCRMTKKEHNNSGTSFVCTHGMLADAKPIQVRPRHTSPKIGSDLAQPHGLSHSIRIGRHLDGSAYRGLAFVLTDGILATSRSPHSHFHCGVRTDLAFSFV